MTIPFPRNAGNQVIVRRPSGGLSVRLPANDVGLGPVRNYPGRGPLPAGALTPNPFQGPAISYGPPLARPTPALTYTPPASRPWASFGRFALRVSPYLALLDYGLGLTPFVFGTRGPGAVAPGEYPRTGMWKRVAGPFYYGDPYQNENPLGSSEIRFIDLPLSGQAVPIHSYDLADIPGDWTEMGLWRYNLGQAGIERWAHHSSWVRVLSSTEATNLGGTSPIPFTSTSPFVPQWVDPFSSPIFGPSPFYHPPFSIIPQRGVNPFRSIFEQNVSGYSDASYPTTGVFGPSPNQVGGGVALDFVPPRPPGAGVKERKPFVVSIAYIPIIKHVFTLTEFSDLVEAFWQALPPEQRYGFYKLHKKDGSTFWIQRKKPLVKHMLRDIYENWETLDLNKGLSKALADRAKDKFQGKASQQMMHFLKSNGWTAPVGPQFGPIL